MRVGPNQTTLMPKIVTNANGPAFNAAAGAHHYRFVGIEMTTSVSSTAETNYGLFTMDTGSAAAPHDIVIDRCYIHGTPGGNSAGRPDERRVARRDRF